MGPSGRRRMPRHFVSVLGRRQFVRDDTTGVVRHLLTAAKVAACALSRDFVTARYWLPSLYIRKALPELAAAA